MKCLQPDTNGKKPPHGLITREATPSNLPEAKLGVLTHDDVIYGTTRAELNEQLQTNRIT